MKTKRILGGALLLFAASCSNDDVLQSSATNGESNSLKTEFAALFKSADKESLKNTILDANLQNSTLTRSTLSQGYVSLLDVVQNDDPILFQFTKEEQEYIKDNNLTYYDLFDY